VSINSIKYSLFSCVYLLCYFKTDEIIKDKDITMIMMMNIIKIITTTTTTIIIIIIIIIDI